MYKVIYSQEQLNSLPIYSKVQFRFGPLDPPSRWEKQIDGWWMGRLSGTMVPPSFLMNNRAMVTLC